MSAETPAPKPPTAMIWTGRAISVLPVLLLTFSAIMKFLGGPDLEKGFQDLGWPLKLAVMLGIIEIGCTILYAVPHTAVLGAILLTGYLGGATATHVRAEDGNWFGAVIVGVLVWLGLLLRDRRLWPLLPYRKV